MNLTFPVYVKVIKGVHGQKSFYRAALLFFPNIYSDNEDLQRAIVKLRRRVKKTADNNGANLSHDLLADMVFNPEVKTEKLKLTLKIGGDFLTEKFFFVTLKQLGRTFAFCLISFHTTGSSCTMAKCYPSVRESSCESTSMTLQEKPIEKAWPHRNGAPTHSAGSRRWILTFG